METGKRNGGCVCAALITLLVGEGFTLGVACMDTKKSSIAISFIGKTSTLGSENSQGFGEFGILSKQTNMNLRFSSVNQHGQLNTPTFLILWYNAP